jgi:uncharacterized surface protein with fasciclin (FAS1) repeats
MLQELLLYHVTGGDIRSTDLRRLQIVDMLAGGRTLIFKSWRGKVYVNKSRVVAADVVATNGVAHVINRVLIPRSFYGKVSSLPSDAPPVEEPVELDS